MLFGIKQENPPRVTLPVPLIGQESKISQLVQVKMNYLNITFQICQNFFKIGCAAIEKS